MGILDPRESRRKVENPPIIDSQSCSIGRKLNGDSRGTLLGGSDWSGNTCKSVTGLSRPRTARDVAHARKRVQRRRPRVLGIYFLAGRRKTRERSVSDRPSRADRVAPAILEPRASSHEQCIVVTSPVPRRFRTMHHHAFVSLAR